MFIVVKIALLYHCNIVKIARKGSHITILPYFYGTNDRKDDLTPSWSPFISVTGNFKSPFIPWCIPEICGLKKSHLTLKISQKQWGKPWNIGYLIFGGMISGNLKINQRVIVRFLIIVDCHIIQNEEKNTYCS